jgi:hypothetical protein
MVNEDGLGPVAVNNIGGGGIQGAGIGLQGEPGVYLRNRKRTPVMNKMMKRIKGFREFTKSDRKGR